MKALTTTIVVFQRVRRMASAVAFVTNAATQRAPAVRGGGHDK